MSMDSVKMQLWAGRDEHERWKAAAAQEGLSLSAWLRRAADEKLGSRERAKERVLELVKEMLS